jgi:hypothetical protein
METHEFILQARLFHAPMRFANDIATVDRPGSVFRRTWGVGDVLRPGRPHRPQGHAASLTSIFFGSAFSGFGMVILRTPLDIVASMLDGSMPDGNWIPRRNTP